MGIPDPGRLFYWLWKVAPLPRRVRWWLLWLGNAKFLVGVTAIVFDDAERVLLLKHTYRKRHPWGPPGGWVGAREDPAAALARELREETGLDITVGEAFHVRGYRDAAKIDFYFLCRHHGGAFRPSAEIAAMRFCPLDELPPDLLPGQRAIFARALALWRTRRGERATKP